MKRFKRVVSLAAFPLLSCTRSSTPPAAEPVPIAAESSGPSTEPRRSQWSFEPAYRSTGYQSTTVSTVRSKTPPERSESIELTSVFSVNVDQRRNPFFLTGQITSLHSNNRNAPTISLPLTFAGTVDSIRVTGAAQLDTTCNQAADIGLGEIRTILGNWPLHLSNNSMWTDSLTSTTCPIGGVPVIAKRLRSYRVTGSAEMDGMPAIIVSRDETIDLQGEGISGQHQVRIGGAGKGMSTIYLDAQSGLPLAIDAQEELNISLVSGRRQDFTQAVRQKVQRN